MEKIKLLLKNGYAFSLECEPACVDELVSHPKFLRMKENGQDIFVSIEDVISFCIENKEEVVNESIQ